MAKFNENLIVYERFDTLKLTAVVIGGGTETDFMIMQALVTNGAQVCITVRRERGLGPSGRVVLYKHNVGPDKVFA